MKRCVDFPVCPVLLGMLRLTKSYLDHSWKAASTWSGVSHNARPMRLQKRILESKRSERPPTALDNCYGVSMLAAVQVVRTTICAAWTVSIAFRCNDQATDGRRSWYTNVVFLTLPRPYRIALTSFDLKLALFQLYFFRSLLIEEVGLTSTFLYGF